MRFKSRWRQADYRSRRIFPPRWHPGLLNGLHRESLPYVMPQQSVIIGSRSYFATESPVNDRGVDQHHGKDDQRSAIKHKHQRCRRGCGILDADAVGIQVSRHKRYTSHAGQLASKLRCSPGATQVRFGGKAMVRFERLHTNRGNGGMPPCAVPPAPGILLFRLHRAPTCPSHCR